MNLQIERACEHDNVVWLVRACGMTISFADQGSAVAFARKLEERVDAPHQLSAETVKHWTAEHFRMLRRS